VGSLVEWSKWIAHYTNGVKSDRIACGPQATVGLIDILVAALVLVVLFFYAAVVWRAFGLPVNPSKQVGPSKQESTLNASAYIDVQSAPSPDARSENRDSVTEITVNKGTAAKPAGMTQLQFVFSGFAMSAQLLCVVFTTLFIYKRTGIALKKIGWRLDQVAGDLRAGLRCFLMLTPIILILNALLQGLTKVTYEHPIQEMIKQYPWLLGIAFWQAAIVAPVSEEFAFRVLLIGWFESIQFGRNKITAFLLGDTLEHPHKQMMPIESPLSPMLVRDSSTPGEILLAQPPTPLNELKLAQQSKAEYNPPWWPALLSGTLFGLAHVNYGVSWVALIVFGMVLGRLYQLRQSIIPVIAVHVLFNSMNVTMLGLSILLSSKQ
ncbi:MAG TPA: CPBP family intramembrane glutamic endopeptidase, partial [Pirellula sp.]|nr:CPBP family intramembrane glutamic endopeptidase [Pirellula sp.]